MDRPNVVVKKYMPVLSIGTPDIVINLKSDASRASGAIEQWHQNLTTSSIVAQPFAEGFRFDRSQDYYYKFFLPYSSGIEENDSTTTIIYKIASYKNSNYCENNSHAYLMLDALRLLGQQIDPYPTISTFLIYVLNLEVLGIYGKNLEDLATACGNELMSLMAVIRATQLGVIRKEIIYDAILSKDRIDTMDIMKKVQAKLPRFGHDINLIVTVLENK